MTISRSRKARCEGCGCIPHAPRRRCVGCAKLVCVSNCWNRKLTRCSDCAGQEAVEHPRLAPQVEAPFLGYQPHYVICCRCGNWTYPPCRSCGSTGPFR